MSAGQLQGRCSACLGTVDVCRTQRDDLAAVHRVDRFSPWSGRTVAITCPGSGLAIKGFARTVLS